MLFGPELHFPLVSAQTESWRPVSDPKSLQHFGKTLSDPMGPLALYYLSEAIYQNVSF